MIEIPGVFDVERLFQKASSTSSTAALACLKWEEGGDAGPVGDTADDALMAGRAALAAMLDVAGVTRCGCEIESRQARLGQAAWCMLMAGTDEGGRSSDLSMAAWLFAQAAIA